MNKYRFDNSILPPGEPINLLLLLGDPEFDNLHWCGSGRDLLGWAPSSKQLVVPWTLEVAVEMVQVSPEGKPINPKTCTFVVEGFSVPDASALLCRAQDSCGDDFGSWWLDIACSDLLYVAHKLTQEESDDGYCVDNPWPVFLALDMINEASREWLEKQKSRADKLKKEDSDHWGTVTSLNLV
jgi:hypothetical protein